MKGAVPVVIRWHPDGPPSIAPRGATGAYYLFAMSMQSAIGEWISMVADTAGGDVGDLAAGAAAYHRVNGVTYFRPVKAFAPKNDGVEDLL